MGFGGQIFSDAWNGATELGRRGAAALSEGAHWVGERTTEAARYVHGRAVEAGQWIADTSQRVGQQLAHRAKETWKSIRNTAGTLKDVVVAKGSDLYRAGVKKIKEFGRRGKAVVNKVACWWKNARDNAKKHTKGEFKGKLELSMDGKLTPATSAEGEVETKFSLGVGVEGSAHGLRWGGDNDFVSIGYAKGSAMTGYSYDPLEGQHEIDLYRLEGKASVLHGEGEGYFINNALQLKGEGDVLSASGSLRPIGVSWGHNVGVNGDAGAEAVVASARVEGVVRITPKTIYDNSFGAAIDYFSPGSSFAHLPDWTDRGVAVGVGGEAGYGAAARARYQLGHYDGFTGLQVEAKAGAGPLVGLKGMVGIATKPERETEAGGEGERSEGGEPQ